MRITSRPSSHRLASIATASLCSLALSSTFGCGPKPQPTQTPTGAAATPEQAQADAEAKAKAEEEAKAKAEEEAKPKRKVPEDAFSVGTFNLDWAFDAIGKDGRPKAAKDHVPPDDATWEWKRDRIVEIIVAENLDIVVLAELGGDRELSDIVSSITTAKNGIDYQYAYQPGEEHATGQNVAILSRFPLRNERRFDIFLPKHVAADIELPSGDEITVVAFHMTEGEYKSQTKRRDQQASSLKRQVKKEQKKHPVIMMGTVGSEKLPTDDDYKTSAPGVLAGADTGRDSDDCHDSATEGLAQMTTGGDGLPYDRIFTCGLEMRNAETAAADKIIRKVDDGPDTPWPSVKVEEDPFRDVSDHLVVWAEVALPKKAAPEGEGKEGEAKEGDGG